ncbi:hypothetical protein ACJD0Z_00450 [Flavobacteriaceae bacterium M23B6Z8]
MNDIELKVHSLLKDYPEIAEFNREHIFYAIVNSVNEVNSSEQMQMFYTFMQLQKAFRALRAENFHLYSSYLTKLEALPYTYQNYDIECGLKAIKYPIMAYEKYYHKNYREAKKDLDKSIRYLDKLIDKGCIECTQAKMEQTLNLVRIALAERKEKKAVALASNILYFAMSEQKDTNYANLCFPDVISNAEERKSITFYYLNSILIAFSKASKNTLIDILEAITALPNTIYGSLFMIFKKYLIYFKKNNVNILLNEISPKVFKDIPFVLQYWLLETLKPMLNENDTLKDIETFYRKNTLYTQLKNKPVPFCLLSA